MKATDYRPQHFEKGRAFSKSDFDEYIANSDNFAKTIYTRYLPCVAGGIVLCVLFSNLIGGFFGNMLGILCIFAGLILGAVFNLSASKKVKASAAKLGITTADVKNARKHVKEGTLAWDGGDIPQQNPAAAPSLSTAGAQKTSSVKCGAQNIAASSTEPIRGIYAAGGFAALWFLLIIFQSIFGPKTTLNSDALFFCTAGIFGAGVYLISQSEMKNKISGSVIAVICAVLNSFNAVAVRNEKIYNQEISIFDIIDLGNIAFYQSFAGAILTSILVAGAAWAVSLLIKQQPSLKKTRLCALGAGGIYFLSAVIKATLSLRFIRIRDFADFYNKYSGALFDAICLFLVCVGVYYICNMKSTKVKMSGIGLVWCWLGAAGGLVGFVSSVILGIIGSQGFDRIYTPQFLVSICAITGYVLLICGKRAGLYVLLLGSGTMIAAQAAITLNGVVYGATQFIPVFFSNAFGAVNPLLGWLVVRYSDNKNGGFASASAQPKTVYPTSSQQPSAAQIQNPVPVQKPKDYNNTFFVFAAQGQAMGTVQGDVIAEKAEKIKEEYEPAKDMRLEIIRPYVWGGTVNSSNSNGVIMTSFNLRDYQDRVRNYLLGLGIQAEAIQKGIEISADESLQLSNPFSGVYVIGIPITLPEKEQEPVPAPEIPDEKTEVPEERYAVPELEFDGREQRGQFTYEYYKAKSVAEAKAFLNFKIVNLPLYYVMVETPEGTWGKDKDGIFLGNLADFQKNLALREVDGTPDLLPHSMQDVAMAAQGITDNYLLGVTCGSCGEHFEDGVAYRAKTIVKCPKCGKYNLVNTENIHYNNL